MTVASEDIIREDTLRKFQQKICTSVHDLFLTYSTHDLLYRRHKK